PVEGGPRPYLTVATTRPETLLGDTAVAVNPKDARRAAFIGKTARLPITDIAIPIIADEAVDPAFGTGFVKVTPAHDANDFEIGQRHGLEAPLIMREDGTMGEEDGKTERRKGDAKRVPPQLVGLDRFEAREVIVQLLRERQLLEKVEPHRHAVRHCYRCETVVEPRLSDQWFVKMKPLAEPALAAYREGQYRLVPERWHATFGWPERTPDLARFYPGHTMVTAPEILFFWVARMIMAGYHFLGARPFSTVYLHGTVRDTQHRKMSKSLGNGIDPLDVVRLYGA